MRTINLVIVPIALTTFYRAELSCAATSTLPPYPCPEFDGSSYADATGSKYNIQCSTDYPGNDLPAVHTDTFEECLKACDTYVPGSSAEADNYAPCVGVSWGAGNPSENCYLKYQITTVKHNDVGLSSGYLANDTLPNSHVTSPRSSQSTTSAPATGAAQAATFTTSTTQPTSRPSSGSDSHSDVDVGAGTAQAATSTTQPTSRPSSGSDSHSDVDVGAGTAQAATSTTQPTSRPSNGPDSHSNVGVGAGVGVGVGVVGTAILASILYLMRRQIKIRPEEPLELSAGEDDEKPDRLRKPSAETRVDELHADNEPGELFEPRGPRAELFEIRGPRVEMA